MSPTLITNLTYAIAIIGSAVLAHFGIISTDIVPVVIAAVGGHAAGSTSLVVAGKAMSQAKSVKEALPDHG